METVGWKADWSVCPRMVLTVFLDAGRCLTLAMRLLFVLNTLGRGLSITSASATVDPFSLGSGVVISDGCCWRWRCWVRRTRICRAIKIRPFSTKAHWKYRNCLFENGRRNRYHIALALIEGARALLVSSQCLPFSVCGAPSTFGISYFSPIYYIDTCFVIRFPHRQLIIYLPALFYHLAEITCTGRISKRRNNNISRNQVRNQGMLTCKTVCDPFFETPTHDLSISDKNIVCPCDPWSLDNPPIPVKCNFVHHHFL